MFAIGLRVRRTQCHERRSNEIIKGTAVKEICTAVEFGVR